MGAQIKPVSDSFQPDGDGNSQTLSHWVLYKLSHGLYPLSFLLFPRGHRMLLVERNQCGGNTLDVHAFFVRFCCVFQVHLGLPVYGLCVSTRRYDLQPIPGMEFVPKCP